MSTHSNKPTPFESAQQIRMQGLDRAICQVAGRSESY